MKYNSTHVQLFLEAVDGQTDIEELLHHFQDVILIADGINEYNKYAQNKFHFK